MLLLNTCTDLTCHVRVGPCISIFPMTKRAYLLQEKGGVQRAGSFGSSSPPTQCLIASLRPASPATQTTCSSLLVLAKGAVSSKVPVTSRLTSHGRRPSCLSHPKCHTAARLLLCRRCWGPDLAVCPPAPPLHNLPSVPSLSPVLRWWAAIRAGRTW